ncbi:MAG: hypothetical protein ACYTHM_02280 [Planctomycetota bacterium]|jgi:hypothetical protein
MAVSCKTCERFFDRTREAIGVCTSCGAGFCGEHGLVGETQGGLCLFCADEFGHRLDVLVDEEEKSSKSG